MQKSTTLLGTACVLAVAALAASPAAAAPLTDMAGSLTTNFGIFDQDNNASNEGIKGWLLGGSVAAPIPELAGLNAQLDLSYKHNWDSGFSQEDWEMGGSIFWAGMDGRIGVNFNHVDFTRIGHVNNGGVFGEWYFGNFTAMAKGGFLSSGGSGFGGDGTYLGAAGSFYITPDVAITGGVDWGTLIQGQGRQLSGRQNIRFLNFGATAEWQFLPAYNLSGYVGYAYSDGKVYTVDTQAQIATIGVRWRFGAGSLIEHHRNGELNPWLPGTSAMRNF